MAAQTLYDKLWDSHLVHEDENGTACFTQASHRDDREGAASRTNRESGDRPIA